jgi:hypothetical protein
MAIFNENFTIEIPNLTLKEYAYMNFDVNDIYPDEDIIRWVKENYNPEDVFNEDELTNWAGQNGYVKD